jgi:hypothetical protein
MTMQRIGILSLVFLLTVATTGWGGNPQCRNGKFHAKDTFVQPVDPGTITPVPGGIRLRGAINIYHIDASDERITGDYTITLNANWDMDYAGPVWGSFTCDRPDGGEWSGVFYGWRYKVGAAEWKAVFHEFGYGSAGNIEGLRFKSIEVAQSTPTTFSGSISGNIFADDPE